MKYRCELARLNVNKVSSMKKYFCMAVIALTPAFTWAETATEMETFKPHPYFDATIGAVKAIDGCDGIGNDQCDDTDTGLRLAFGYQMNQQGFLELGYMNFGETSYDFSDSFSEDVTAKAEVNAIYAMGGLIIPTQYVELFGKAGFALAKVEITANATDNSVSVDSTSLSPIASAGLHIPVSKNFGFVAQMDYLIGAGDEEETGESDMFMVGAGARLTF